MDAALYHRLLPLFIAEAEQHLDAMDDAILELCRMPGTADALAVIARAAHTIKGNAAALGMRQMVIEAQRLEWWALDAPALTPAAIASLHDARRELRRLITEVADDIGLQETA